MYAVALAPHFCEKRLAGIHWSGEPTPDLTKKTRIGASEPLQHGTSGVPKSAEAVKDGLWKTAHLGELRISVQRVVICGRIRSVV